MRDIDEIIETINNWEGTFDELVDEFTKEEYDEMWNNYCWESFNVDWIYECCYSTGDYNEFLYNLIGDTLIFCIKDGCDGITTANLFRIWNR